MSPEIYKTRLWTLLRPDSGRYWDHRLWMLLRPDSGRFWDQTLDVTETRVQKFMKPESRSLWDQSPEVYETRLWTLLRQESRNLWEQSSDVTETEVHADNSVKQCSVISEDQSSDIAGDLRSRYFCRSEFRHFRGQSQNIIERLEKHFFFSMKSGCYHTAYSSFWALFLQQQFCFFLALDDAAICERFLLYYSRISTLLKLNNDVHNAYVCTLCTACTR